MGKAQGHGNRGEMAHPLRRGKNRFLLALFFLLVLFFVGVIWNIMAGSVKISLSQIGRIFSDWLSHLFSGKLSQWSQQTGDVNEMARQILFRIRLPRLSLCAILGGALALSGYLLQVFFRNPIAGPFILGISSGAKLLVGFTIIFIAPSLGSLPPLSLVVAAFAGSLFITGIVLLFSQRVHNMSFLLVIGIMMSYICNAMIDFCITFADDHQVAGLKNWSMGSFSGANWDFVLTSFVICGLCLIFTFALSKPISGYRLGESYARSMGINVKLFRFFLILISSLLSSCVTAFAGPISFVGIAVPHMVRSFLHSSDPKAMIPICFLGGSCFCLFSDLLARTLFSPTELMIGTVTAFFGAPVVIYMMVAKRRKEA